MMRSSNYFCLRYLAFLCLAVWCVLVVWVPVQAQAQAPRGLSELLGHRMALGNPAERRRVVNGMRRIEQGRRQLARGEALRRGLPERWQRPRGGVVELVDWFNGQPLYVASTNVNAGISTGANLLWPAPTSLSGAGVVIGLWDGGAARSSHQEFGGRVVVRDGAPVIDHATHVAGTMAAAGVVAAARGMAGAAQIDSYDWNNDTSEMAARGATVAGEVGRLSLSNHSYGYISGWSYVGSAAVTWEWFGSGATAASVEDDFGRYNSYTQDADALAYNAPYYLMFRSAGNERSDNPVAGQKVVLTTGAAAVAYDAALHPKGDGVYRGGFDSIGFSELAKNVLTVGSVADAVTGGLRDPSKAAVSFFSSWGPTDDGRIKPDVVANGEAVYSTVGVGDAAYGSIGGTSMSTPSACGSAALLIEQFGRLFPGQAMRASTLKSLLIHTATDRGQVGPDYKFGWGLVDVAVASDLIQAAHDVPDQPAMVESALGSVVTVRSHAFTWDGVSPIRATLGWTDPAGVATSTADSRTPRLVNDLNLKVIAPDGSEYRPYVMPFVGTWTQASMDAPATTGVNSTDNTEQVYIPAPPQVGGYQAVVSHTGALTTGSQVYSLILTGAAPSGPTPPSIIAVSPSDGESGAVNLTVYGSSFQAGATVSLTRTGQPRVSGVVVTLNSTAIECTLDVTGLAPGLWNVTVTNPDGLTGELPAGFAVVGTLWGQNFDTPLSGWTAEASVGLSLWSVVDTQSHSPPSSWLAPGPAARGIDTLTSETIDIPAGAASLKLSFWHRYALQEGLDGGVLEFSLDNGAWFEVGNEGAAESIIRGDYPMSLTISGFNPNAWNPLAGRAAWTGDSGANFTEVVVALSDVAKYAGRALRVRWRLATNGSVASPGGWRVDSVRLTGVVVRPPVIVTAAAADVASVTGLTTGLTVTAADDGGVDGLIYTWSATGGDVDRPVVFSDNGSTAARVTTATFAAAGAYVLEVVVRDGDGAMVASRTGLEVVSTPSETVVSPASVTMEYGSSQLFTGVVRDQFGDVPAVAPVLVWSASGGGLVDAGGLFSAAAVGGPFVISAVAGVGGPRGTAEVTVTKAPAAVVLGGLTQTYDGFPKEVTVTTTPLGLPVTVTYAGAAAAPSAFGAYAVVAEVTDPNFTGGATATLTIAGVPLADWQARYFTSAQVAAGAAADGADPDDDGLANFTEYAVGSDPLTFSPSLGGGRDATGVWVAFDRPKDLPDVEYVAETSADLENWTAVPLTVTVDGPVQKVRAFAAAGPTNRRFIQVRFVRKPAPVGP